MSSSTGMAGSAVAHLPDCSEELASVADLTVAIHGTPLKLHSAVLASGSRVLRSALCNFQAGAADVDAAASAAGGVPGDAAAGGGAAAAASKVAAVQKAFEGFSLEDVQLFLRLLYNPTDINIEAAMVGKVTPADWDNLLTLADKLDAPAVLQACDALLTRTLPEACNIWTEWLLLADKLGMERLVARSCAPVVKRLVTSSTQSAKNEWMQLRPLSVRSWQLIAEAMQRIIGRVHGTRFQGYVDATGYVPSTAGWRQPGDLFL